jgi:FkbM family methyltransferase
MASLWRKLVLGRHARVCYSQCGEDLIADSVLVNLGIRTPSYLDIGANDPVCLSNTYYFYRKGGRGVCVEPDPVLHERIRKKRPRDICLNVGIGAAGAEKAPFYCMSSSTLNTFSREDAERFAGYGKEKIVKVLEIPLLPVNDVLGNHFPSCPNLVSLDAEGLDMSILKTFDFSRFRPQVFVIETLTYTEDKSEGKEQDIIRYMESVGYMAYADTYVNTLFVDRAAWKSR